MGYPDPHGHFFFFGSFRRMNKNGVQIGALRPGGIRPTRCWRTAGRNDHGKIDASMSFRFAE
jgi:hypothetical protein